MQLAESGLLLCGFGVGDSNISALWRKDEEFQFLETYTFSLKKGEQR